MKFDSCPVIIIFPIPERHSYCLLKTNITMVSTTQELPRYQTAIIAQGPKEVAVKRDAAVPRMDPDMVMVKTAVVALNPVDIKALDYRAEPGAIMGTDFAGTIVALGAEVIASGRLAVGDRVASLVCGMNKMHPDVGAFAEYVAVVADLAFKLPDNMRLEDAAPLGLASMTSAYALFSELGLPASLDQLELAADGKGEQPGNFVLVAGGSTATGTRAIQLLKTAGFRPVATCSPANFDLVRRFGAVNVFDYHSPSCADDIRSYTKKQLAYALDCVTEAETTQLCYAAIGRAGGHYVALEPFRETITRTRISTVKPSWFNVRTVLGGEVGEDPGSGREFSSETVAFAYRAHTILQKLLDRGLVDMHPVKVMTGSWEGIVKGIAQIRQQPPSAFKLVYRIP